MVVVNIRKKKPAMLNPEKVVSSLELLSGQTVIDYGTEGGFWAIPIAKKVGSKGRVLAIGKIKERQEVVARKAKAAHVSNILFLLRDDEENLVPTKERADWIIVTNVLSRLRHDEALLTKLADNSEVGTKMVIVDWAEESFLGTDPTNRILEDKVVLAAAKGGFKFNRLLDVGTFHFGLLFEFTGEKYRGRKK